MTVPNMTQCLIEPRRFPLPAEWTVAPDALRATPAADAAKSTLRRHLHGVVLAACAVLAPMHTAQAQPGVVADME